MLCLVFTVASYYIVQRLEYLLKRFCAYLHNVFAGNTNTLVEPRHYGILVEQLAPCSPQWDRIAGGLRFQRDEIENIKASPSFIIDAPMSWLREVISQWITWTPGDARGSKDRPTLEALKRAVDKAGFGMVASTLSLSNR